MSTGKNQSPLNQNYNQTLFLHYKEETTIFPCTPPNSNQTKKKKKFNIKPQPTAFQE